ncbi:MMPL family transporter, partial [Streptomyces sp. NPDC059525]|uniref:MMPL family transporter n=1 Tax=Streptomyces sp. NPDC059525 TaxID=3346857 RepID=UPI0036A219DF
SVVPLADPRSSAAQRLVHDVRATPAPAGASVLVGGPSAVLVDAKATVGARLPLALYLIALTTFALLLGFTRSLLLPLKAIALNALSLAAVLGAMVWVFQSGHLRSLLGFTPGPLSTTMPVLLFCIVFGLSVDYEVFVLARIKEAHEAGEDNPTSIVSGIARTGLPPPVLRDRRRSRRPPRRDPGAGHPRTGAHAPGGRLELVGALARDSGPAGAPAPAAPSRAAPARSGRQVPHPVGTGRGPGAALKPGAPTVTPATPIAPSLPSPVCSSALLPHPVTTTRKTEGRPS